MTRWRSSVCLALSAVSLCVATSCSSGQGATDSGDNATVSDTQKDTSTASDTGSESDTGSASGSDTDSSTGEKPELTLPTANAPFDYQLGGAYPPPQGVEILSRDRQDNPAPGLYNICYINGFQTQPDEEGFWTSQHPELILRDSQGNPVEDEDWGELLLDTSTPQKREALAVIVGNWIEGCALAGFDAVEVDNLDTYSRSTGLLSMDNNVTFMAMLVEIGHAAGLAMGQKNSTELLPRSAELGTDFAVAEECNRWDECADYQDVYGDLVFVIEYRAQDFDAGCQNFPELSIILRDLDVSPSTDSAYVYDAC